MVQSLPLMRARLAAALAHVGRRMWRRSDLTQSDKVILDLLSEALQRLGQQLKPMDAPLDVIVANALPDVQASFHLMARLATRQTPVLASLPGGPDAVPERPPDREHHRDFAVFVPGASVHGEPTQQWPAKDDQNGTNLDQEMPKELHTKDAVQVRGLNPHASPFVPSAMSSCWSGASGGDDACLPSAEPMQVVAADADGSKCLAVAEQEQDEIETLVDDEDAVFEADVDQEDESNIYEWGDRCQAPAGSCLRDPDGEIARLVD